MSKVRDSVEDIREIDSIQESIQNIDITLVQKPAITSPTTGAVDFAGAVTSSVFVAGGNYRGVHDYVEWQAGNSDFSTLYTSYSGASNLTSWAPSVGMALQLVYVRVRYGSDNHLSAWSEVISYTTPNIYVQTPTLTVTGTPSSVPESPTLTTSAFSVFNGSDTHVSTDWQVVRVSDSAVVWENLASTSNKLSVTVPSATLATSTAYTFRARHNGATYGSSSWVEVAGTTLATFNIISGVSWDESNDTYSRTDGGTTGNAHIAIASQMKRCVLNANGTVNYYLDANDSTKKADGSAADLSGAAGNVMVEIPKFYYKYVYSGTTHTWRIAAAPAAGYTVHPAFIREGVEVSYRYRNAYVPRYNGTKLISASGVYPTANQTRAVFRTQAAANGAGWSQVDWYLHSAIQLIYLVEYADFDTQTTIGMGRTQLSGGNWADGSYYALSGLSNSKGNGTFSVSIGGTSFSTDYMSYRGIEHWYGHLYQFIDGVNVQGSTYWVSNKPSTFADDVFSGDYANIGTAGATSGYPSSLKNVSGGFLPNAVAGSTSVGLCDYYAYGGTGNYVVQVGGLANAGLAAGGFLLYSIGAASLASVNLASGLCR